MKKSLKLIFSILFIIGLIGGTSIIAQRINVENKNNTYQFALDFNSISSLKSDEKIDEVYKTLKENDINTIVFDNLSIRDLQKHRALKYLTVNDYMEEKDDFDYPFKGFIPDYANKENIVIMFSKKDFIKEEIKVIKEYLDEKKIAENKDNIFFYIDAPMTISYDGEKIVNPILTTKFFINRKGIEFVDKNGLNPMLSISNEHDEKVQSMLLNQILDLSKNYNIDKIQMSGLEVIGYPKNTVDYMEELKKNGISIVTTEFQTKIGLNPYLQKGLEQVIRGHEVNLNQLKLSNDEFSARISRAVKERNMRVIIIRDYINYKNSNEINKSISDLVTSLKDAKQQLNKGYEHGQAKPYIKMNRDFKGDIFIALAASSLIGLLMLSLFENKITISILVAVVMFIGAIAVTKLQIDIGIKAYALGTAIMGACAAVIVPDKSKIRSISINYILTAFIATATGIIVASILYGTEYILKLKSFSGVKMLYILPPVLVAIWILAEMEVFKKLKITKVSNFEEFTREAINYIKGIKWYTYIIAILVMVGAVIYIRRSGNEGSASDLELQIRRLLEEIFYVRPRTKEFMLGYPAVLLSYYFLKEKIKYGQYMLIPAAIATMSTVNTFTHLHTPIKYSLLRAFYGIVLGAIVGLVYIFIFKKIKLFVNKECK